MPEPDEVEQFEPVIQPRLVRLLKKRPRLIEDDFRKELLDELDKELCRRRAPDRLSDEAVRGMFNRAADSTAPPVRRRVRSRLEQANNGILENL